MQSDTGYNQCQDRVISYHIKATVGWNLVSAPPPASDITPARILSLLSLFPLLHLHFKVRQLFVVNFVVGLTINTL